MKKILFVTTMAGNPWGGSEELWSSMAKTAHNNKIDTAISYYNWKNTPSKITNLKDLGISCFPRKRILGDNFLHKIIFKLNEHVFGLRQLKNIENKFKPNHMIISMGGFCDLELAVIQKFLLKTNINFSLIVHVNPENRYFNLMTVRKMNEICDKAKKVFFVSKRLLEIAKRQTGFEFKNAEIILNPVNLSKNDLVKYNGLSSKLNMACVGRVNFSVKGQALLIQVLAQQKWRDRDFTLNFYGKGPDQDLLKFLILKHKLDSKVFLRGHVNDIRNDIWSKNQILIMPSYYEGLPLSLVEAMLCGRTAVSTDVGGAREVLSDDNGFFASAATFTSFDNAMENMWSNRNELLTKGENAREEIINYLSTFPSYIKILNNLFCDV